MAVSAVWRLACLLAPIPIRTKEHAKAHRLCLRLVEPTDRRDALCPSPKIQKQLLLVLYTNSEELPAFRPDPETIFATKNVDVGLDFARSDEFAIDPTKPVAPVALFPPAVLVMTRPYHAGARARGRSRLYREGR